MQSLHLHDDLCCEGLLVPELQLAQNTKAEACCALLRGKWPCKMHTRSVSSAPTPLAQPRMHQALLSSLLTLAQVLLIYKGKCLFTEQQYRGHKHCPEEKGAFLLQDMAAACKTHHPTKGTASLPEHKHHHQCPAAGTGEALLVRAPKHEAAGQAVFCLPPCPRAALLEQRGRSWTLETLC